MGDLFSTNYRIFWSRLVGVLVITYALLSYPLQVVPPWTSGLGAVLGLVLLATAAFGRVWCLVFIGGRKNDELAADGPYSIVRNPLYVFSFLGAVGFGLTVKNPPLAAFLAILFAVYYRFVVRKEEGYLAAKFGTEFQAYCARTPRWFPRFSQYRESRAVTVSPKRIREGILDAMWFIWIFVLWTLLEVFQLVGSGTNGV